MKTFIRKPENQIFLGLLVIAVAAIAFGIVENETLVLWVMGALLLSFPVIQFLLPNLKNETVQQGWVTMNVVAIVMIAILQYSKSFGGEAFGSDGMYRIIVWGNVISTVLFLMLVIVKFHYQVEIMPLVFVGIAMLLLLSWSMQSYHTVTIGGLLVVSLWLGGYFLSERFYISEQHR